MRKEEARNIYLAQRLELSNEEHKKRSAVCTNTILNRILPACRTIHIFLPITHRKEPNTLPLFYEINKRFPDKSVVTPVITANGTLIHVQPDWPLELHAGRWNIPVPEYTRIVKPEEFDVVLLPMLIFDVNGNRVGYGKGYYDSFLPLCRSNCVKVGISLFEPVDKIDDVFEGDVPMDACITPQRMYVFNNELQQDFINLSA